MFVRHLMSQVGFPGSASGKEPACQCPRCKRCRFDPWVGKIPWRRTWQPTPVFLPGESHGQRTLAGYSTWCHKESDTTEASQHTRMHAMSQAPESQMGQFTPHSTEAQRPGRQGGRLQQWEARRMLMFPTEARGAGHGVGCQGH